MARPGWLAGVVVSALLLTGCSGDEPAAEPPRPRAPTSPVTTTSPTPAPPELPAAARRNTKAGAIAFAHHYIELINFAANSGQTRDLHTVSQSQCHGCTGLMRSIRDIYSSGGWIRTDGLSPRSWSAFGNRSGSTVEIAVTVWMSPETRKTSAASQETTSKPDRAALNLRLRYAQERWIVVEMGLM